MVGNHNIKVGDHNMKVGNHNIEVGNHNIKVGNHNIRVGNHDFEVGDHDPKASHLVYCSIHSPPGPPFVFSSSSHLRSSPFFYLTFLCTYYLRGTIVNRTYGNTKTYNFSPIFTANIWSYLSWSPLI